MKVFRPAPPRSAAGNLARTAAQTAIFWLSLLGAGPWLLVTIERAIGLARFALPAQAAIALALFVPMAALNLASGWTMAVAGEGTPFPTATARELVVRGPYRWVRNPMAVGGLGVGLAVAIYLGSWLTIAYILAGGLAWNLIARPMEERDLAGRFGPSYLRYRAAVGCWLPRSRPYRAEP